MISSVSYSSCRSPSSHRLPELTGSSVLELPLPVGHLDVILPAIWKHFARLLLDEAKRLRDLGQLEGEILGPSSSLERLVESRPVSPRR